MDEIKKSVNGQNLWKNSHTVAENRTARIVRMELYFDTISRAVDEGVQIHNVSPLKAMLNELIEYYENGQWLLDYEADERGEIPHDLKRGVLSQDGLHNLLVEIDM